MPLVTKNNIQFNFGSWSITIHFFQEWMEWIRYKEYNWHNFHILYLGIIDNYPFHPYLDLEFYFSIMGLNFVFEVERYQEGAHEDIINLDDMFERVPEDVEDEPEVAEVS